MFFYAVAKNLNWKILTKNLVIFKFREFHKKPIYRGELPSIGGGGGEGLLDSFQI